MSEIGVLFAKDLKNNFKYTDQPKTVRIKFYPCINTISARDPEIEGGSPVMMPQLAFLVTAINRVPASSSFPSSQ